jgi:hypothetical protein
MSDGFAILCTNGLGYRFRILVSSVDFPSFYIWYVDTWSLDLVTCVWMFGLGPGLSVFVFLVSYRICIPMVLGHSSLHEGSQICIYDYVGYVLYI